MAETNNNTQEYVKTMREQVASRIQTYNTNQLISEQLTKMNELITGLIQYQQRCTDIAIAAFGIPEGTMQEQEETQTPAEPELQLEDPVEQAPAEAPAPEPVSAPELEPVVEPQTKVPDAPNLKKTGKVPDFKVK